MAQWLFRKQQVPGSAEATATPPARPSAARQSYGYTGGLRAWKQPPGVSPAVAARTYFLYDGASQSGP